MRERVCVKESVCERECVREIHIHTHLYPKLKSNQAPPNIFDTPTTCPQRQRKRERVCARDIRTHTGVRERCTYTHRESQRVCERDTHTHTPV